MPYTITRENGVNDAMAVQEAINAIAAMGQGNTVLADHLRELRDSIEEQVKPAALESIAFGSAVLAFVCGHDPMQWVRTSPPEYSQWTNRDGNTVPWQKLCEPEVLRVGIGEAPGDAYARGYEDGVESNLPSPVDRSNIRSALQDLGWGSGSVELATDAVMKALS